MHLVIFDHRTMCDSSQVTLHSKMFFAYILLHNICIYQTSFGHRKLHFKLRWCKTSACNISEIIFIPFDHLFSQVLSPHEESKCLLEQIKIFQCGGSQICAKNLIWQGHQAVQGDVVGQVWVILSFSKVLEEQMALSDPQVLCIQDLWEEMCWNYHVEYGCNTN